MVNVQVMESTSRHVGGSPDDNHLVHRVYAHELAHQYWGHLAPPASIEDFWIAETFSEVFSCMYVGAAFDPKECASEMKDKRLYWEARDPGPLATASLSRAYSTFRQPRVVYDYGPYLFAEMLRPRLGKEAFFGALDLLLTEHPHEPVTTERLQQYLEAASGQDLSDFFDFWVHSGFVPHLQLSWTVDGSDVVGEVTSDVPFGTFDVAVRVWDPKGDETKQAWAQVQVVDGVGRFVVPRPGPAKRLKIELDPDLRTLARSRAVKRVDELAAR
jgi:aminopeptidase N